MKVCVTYSQLQTIRGLLGILNTKVYFIENNDANAFRISLVSSTYPTEFVVPTMPVADKPSTFNIDFPDAVQVEDFI